MPSSSSLSRLVLAALGALLISTGPGQAACDPSTDPDQTDIANARAAVAANCDCSGATSHLAYVSCAGQQANAVLVNKDCASAVRRCAGRSTCGRPGSFTCCPSDSPRCSIKRNGALC